MSKPLELTIYPPRQPRPIGPEFRIWFHECLAEGDLMTTKRLTESELAAEYWRAQSEYLQEATFITTDEQAAARVGTLMEMQAATLTLHRFATHPHYFEATEPESDTE